MTTSPAGKPEHAAEAPQVHSRRRSIPGWVRRLASLSDSPQRTAAAFSLGVFLSFSPFFGLQIAIGLGTATVLRLNRLAVFLGLCANLPWLMVPWYALTTAAAAAVLDVPIAADLPARMSSAFELSVYSREFWNRLIHLFWPFLGSFVLGSTVGAALLGLGTYCATARLIARVHSSE